MNYEYKLINNVFNISHESMNLNIDTAKSIRYFTILLSSGLDRLSMTTLINISKKPMTVRNIFWNHSNKYMIYVHYTNYN